MPFSTSYRLSGVLYRPKFLVALNELYVALFVLVFVVCENVMNCLILYHSGRSTLNLDLSRGGLKSFVFFD